MPANRIIPTLGTVKGSLLPDAIEAPRRRPGRPRKREAGDIEFEMDDGGNSGWVSELAAKAAGMGKGRELGDFFAPKGKGRAKAEQRLMAAIFKAHLSIIEELKGERNADRILSAYQALAALALVRVMIFGDKQDSKSASKEILDRVLGRSVERKMTMSLNVDGMTLAEVENELKRLASGDTTNVGGQEAKALEVTFAEGADSQGDEGGEVQAEPDSESVSGESGKD